MKVTDKVTKTKKKA